MTATAAAPASFLVGSARVEVGVVLANMAMATLGGGGDEGRNQDHEQPPRPARGDLFAAVVDGPGARAHRVHDTPVRAGRAGRAAGLGPPRRGGDRHRPGGFGSVRRGPGGFRRAGESGLLGAGAPRSVHERGTVTRSPTP